MRKTYDRQLKVGQVNIEDIEINLRARDEIPKTLLGIQAVYRNRALMERIFEILESGISPEIDKNTGRPGMELWKIFVLGVLRLVCNIDYDRLLELSNEHKTIRKFLGHSLYDDDRNYALQTLKDNISRLTPQLLDEINQEIVKFGRNEIFKKKRKKSKVGVIHIR